MMTELEPPVTSNLNWFETTPTLLVVGLAGNVLVIGFGAMVLGIAAGTAYTHNLSYSLEEPGKRARNAGVYEALVGVAFMIPPALGGLVARWTNTPSNIFWIGAGLAVVVGIMQNVALAVTKR